MTMYAHLITIFRKIDPEKLYWEFTYFEERSFQSAAFGARKKELFKIDGKFYRVDIVEKISPLKQLPNLVVKHGRHTIFRDYVD